MNKIFTYKNCYFTISIHLNMVCLEFQVYNIHFASARVFLFGRIHPRAWTTGTWKCKDRESPNSKLYIFRFLWLINQRPPNVPPTDPTGLIFGLFFRGFPMVDQPYIGWFSRIYRSWWIQPKATQFEYVLKSHAGDARVLQMQFFKTLKTTWEIGRNFHGLGKKPPPKQVPQLCLVVEKVPQALKNMRKCVQLDHFNLEVRTSCRAWVSTLEDDAFLSGLTWSCAPFLMIHK